MEDVYLCPPENASQIKIDASLMGKLNLADFQNAISLLRELCLVNESEHTHEQLELVLSSEPPFIKPRRWHIDALTAHSRSRIKDLDLRLDGALLARLNEAESATLTFTLRKTQDNTEPLAQLQHTIELLPRNQWGGLSHLPDMVAAFVQPNDPAIDRLLKQAAQALRKSQRISDIDGYLGGARRAWEIASAIWSAVAALNIDYALPPASFEQSGQKVRSPSQIESSGLGTCLDLSLLFCAALEQAGLNPVIVFIHGHAFAGFWLQDEEFSTTVVNDITALRKRLLLKELVLFETTLITQPGSTFSQAIETGEQHVASHQDAQFKLLVDIRRTRLQRIRPLANLDARDETNSETTAPASHVLPGVEDAPELPEGPPAYAEDPLDPRDRLQRWQRKLLDLSLRNNLLNFKRNGRKAIQLEAPAPEQLEDALARGQQPALCTRPDLMDGADPRDVELYQSRAGENVQRAHAIESLQKGTVFVNMPPAELETRLVDLFRSARTHMQEGGANTLYLALGFLKWKREPHDPRSYQAPLILVPVSLQRRNARAPFTLKLHGDEPRFNPTLIEMLRQDFGINLGVMEGELPRDDAGLDIRSIWKTVSHAIKDIPGWEVSEDVVLSLFSFAKHLMWKDLSEHSEQLRENPVVRHLLDTPRDAYPPGAPFPAVHELDRHFLPEHVFCPLPADSSQLSAVLAAAQGKDFVLIGPPGTGKSQTIANLIAHSLAQGRRVLFVSEKIAALDVVYRRLREIGLGEFCLELHSNKARKLDVLAQLQAAWNCSAEAHPRQWHDTANQLKQLRDELNVYVERLHEQRRNGLSLFDAIGTLSHGQGLPVLPFAWSAPDQHDAHDLEALRNASRRLHINAQTVGQASLADHPLAPISQSDWSPSWQQQLVSAAHALIAATKTADTTAENFIRAIGLPPCALTPASGEALARLASSLPHAAGQDWRFVLRPDARNLTQQLVQGMALIRQHAELNEQLPAPWSKTTLDALVPALSALNEYRDIQARLTPSWSAHTRTELNKVLALMATLADHQAALSVRYTDAVEQLDTALLQQQWLKAEAALWPASWLGKRRIRKQLAAASSSGTPPDVVNDLHHLNKIRELRQQILALTPDAECADVWKGLASQREALLAALRWQDALVLVREDKAWQDEGFEPIAAGECGAALQADLRHARRLRELAQSLAQQDALGPATESLWSGLSSDEQNLRAAIAFQNDWHAHLQRGALQNAHPRVAEGHCGTTMASHHQILVQRADIEHALTALAELGEASNGLWKGLDSDIAGIEQACRLQQHIASLLVATATTAEQISAAKTAFHALLGDANALLERGGKIALAGEAHSKDWSAFITQRDALITLGVFSDSARTRWQGLPLSQLVPHCQALLAAEHRLRDWCAWCHARDTAHALGLESLTEAIVTQQIPADEALRTFETNYARWWLNATVDHEPVIRGFVSAEHEQRIRDFRAMDEQFTQLTRNWLRARLCAGLPSQESVNRNSEWGILRHELGKKRAHLPLRELIAKIPEALGKLAPCLLMSPLSIAQYIKAGSNAFDLVIFDEASQIPVWDAIGAIARGRQVVMVGDPKQLPPTAFFDRAESDIDDEDVEVDLESILDECIGANLPTRHLNWHYRSRHESLIAFSNQAYYDSTLVTFPSPVTDDRALSLHPVKATYQRGISRTNPAEARLLVADVSARLLSPGFAESGHSIGIVTFNAEQQKLIEDLLDEARRNDARLEPYFDETLLEPVFVKNLENVQGDERDIIYFSLTYGPDAKGQLGMNFGPLNRQGGERRLNVAITRARRELRVFASFKAEQMDLSRTQALGVRDLKHFLEFAEHGSRALRVPSGTGSDGFSSPFEHAIGKALSACGWQVEPQVGASAFRVDLAVVDPDNPGRYLAGVECDGSSYQRSATARDRDKLREEVLRGLGWEIIRVWSTDWWLNPAGTIEKLDTRLRALLAARQQAQT